MASDNLETIVKRPREATAATSAPRVESEFKESHTAVSHESLLERRIGDLNLRLDGTPVARLTRRLYDELERVGLLFRPPVYLSDDWGCPDRVPIIGVPFYMADPALTRLADELMEGVEAETDEEIMRYLRHEAGHAFNYAYRLYDTPDWTAMFGPFLRPYTDEYTPKTFSRSFVRHLPAWYAQKHPDEDFAETFAVWLDPRLNWREVYADWGCLRKLKYVDELAQRIGAQPAPVTADNYDTQEEYLGSTIAEHYSRTTPRRVEIPRAFDTALQDIFPPLSADVKSEAPAADFLKKHRRAIVRTVFYWTGLNYDLVRGLVIHLEERCSALNLQVGSKSSDKLIEVVALIATLAMNRLHTGEFVQK
ncbi:MAG: hypothetical protein L0228_16825 [Planctomycetes bacterium]|nr:hypothetical protein [Planctomycetota bacterium]